MIHRTLRPNEIGGSKILEDLREREKKTEKNDSQFSTENGSPPLVSIPESLQGLNGCMENNNLWCHVIVIRLQDSPRNLLFTSFYKKGEFDLRSRVTWGFYSTHHFNCIAPKSASTIILTHINFSLILISPSYHQIHTSSLYCHQITDLN